VLLPEPLFCDVSPPKRERFTGVKFLGGCLDLCHSNAFTVESMTIEKQTHITAFAANNRMASLPKKKTYYLGPPYLQSNF